MSKEKKVNLLKMHIGVFDIFHYLLVNQSAFIPVQSIINRESKQFVVDGVYKGEMLNNLLGNLSGKFVKMIEIFDNTMTVDKQGIKSVIEFNDFTGREKFYAALAYMQLYLLFATNRNITLVGAMTEKFVVKQLKRETEIMPMSLKAAENGFLYWCGQLSVEKDAVFVDLLTELAFSCFPVESSALDSKGHWNLIRKSMLKRISPKDFDPNS